MAAVMKASGAGYRFDDRHVNWQKRGDLENFLVSIPDIGEKRKVVDFIVKFEPNKTIVLHRHLSDTGQQILYETDSRQ